MTNESEYVSQKSIGSLFYQYAAVFSGVLVSLCFGMHIGWPSPSLPQLFRQNSTIPATSSDGSWIVAMPFLVEPVGCIIGGLLMNRLGRKMCILISSPVLFVSWMVIAYANNVPTLMIARVFAGIGGGMMYISLPIYVGEIADKRIRGFLGCCIQVASKIGILAVNLIGLRLDIEKTAYIAAGVPVLHFLTFCWMPESPYFFLLRKRRYKAESTLKTFAKDVDVDTQITEMTSMIATTSKVTLSDLINSKINRMALGVTLGMRMLEHFSGYYAITFYCLIIFEEAGGVITGTTATCIYFTVQLIASTLGCVIVDKTGRKPLLLVSVIGAGTSLLVEGVYFYLKFKTSLDVTSASYVPLVGLLVYTTSYSIGLSTIPVLMMGEIFPAGIKAFAAGFGISCFGLFATVVSKIFQITKDEYGIHVPFFLFTACCVIGVFFIIYCVPETKGKSLEEIQRDWMSSTKQKKNVIVDS